MFLQWRNTRGSRARRVQVGPRSASLSRTTMAPDSILNCALFRATAVSWYSRRAKRSANQRSARVSRYALLEGRSPSLFLSGRRWLSVFALSVLPAGTTARDVRQSDMFRSRMRLGWMIIAILCLAGAAAPAMDANPQTLDVDGVRVSIDFVDSDFTHGSAP